MTPPSDSETLQGTAFQQKVLRFFEERLSGSPGYEHRGQQIEMALAVAHAIEHEEHLVVEAGTGTGKSLAYLVPALTWASRSRAPVIVSTRTLNLQQQLMEHDLPRLEEFLSFPLRAAQARGWSNYVCLRRLTSRNGWPEELEHEAAALEHQLADGVTPGTRQELSLSEPLWGRVVAESLACSRQGCPYFEDCYLFKDRRQLEKADVIITNHSLVLADLSLKQEGATGILPEASCLVLDEGHHLEQVATQHLGREVTSQNLERLVRQLYEGGSDHDNTGYLPLLRERVAKAPLQPEDKQPLLQRIDFELLGRIEPLKDVAFEFFERVSLALSQTEENRKQLTPDDFDSEAGLELRNAGSLFAGQLQAMSSACMELSLGVREIDLLGAGEVSSEMDGFSTRLKRMARDLEFCLFPESEDYVYWAYQNKNERGMVATPLDVGELLRKELFQPARSIVITSATLAVHNSLDFFAERVGLEGDPRTQFLCLESPFDYPQQVYLGVATDLPQPGGTGYLESLVPEVFRLVTRLRGRTFLLVTSWKLLRQLKLELEDSLAREGIGLLVQGEAPGGKLLATFRGQGDYLLIGTDSFWEGVDVPGDDLSCVIIARLPFRVPTEPVVAAHSRRLERQGKNPFAAFHLPLAILKLRQGFGRLIRTSRDRGIVLVLDHRIRTKGYGRRFFESLPRSKRRAGPLAGLIDEGLDWLLSNDSITQQ